MSQAREQEDVNKGRKKTDIKGRKKTDIKGGETKLGNVKRRQIESDSDSNKAGWQSESVKGGWQSESVKGGCAESTYPANLAISPQYTARALLIEGIVSFARLSEERTQRALLIEGIVSFAMLSEERTPGSWRERGKCHRLPMEDMMEACWEGVTPSTVVSGDAGVGRARDGSHGD